MSDCVHLLTSVFWSDFLAFLNVELGFDHKLSASHVNKGTDFRADPAWRSIGRPVPRSCTSLDQVECLAKLAAIRPIRASHCARLALWRSRMQQVLGFRSQPIRRPASRSSQRSASQKVACSSNSHDGKSGSEHEQNFATRAAAVRGSGCVHHDMTVDSCRRAGAARPPGSALLPCTFLTQFVMEGPTGSARALVAAASAITCLPLPARHPLGTPVSLLRPHCLAQASSQTLVLFFCPVCRWAPPPCWR